MTFIKVNLSVYQSTRAEAWSRSARPLRCCGAGRHNVELRPMTKRRVGIKLPSVEVRFEDLTVEAQAEAAGRELPSIFNSYRNWVEVRPLENNWHLMSLCDGPSQGMCVCQVQAGQVSLGWS